MKGVSAVIAIILMLMITIALAGMAYTYMSGVFTAKTAVVLTITDAECKSTGVRVWVRNDGTVSSGAVTVTVTTSAGGTITCTIAAPGLAPGAESSCPAGSASPGQGYRTITATAGSARARGSVYCPV